MNLADRHELEWREAREGKAPREQVDALELRWRETLAGVDSLLDYVPMVSPHFRRPNHMRPLAQLFRAAEEAPVQACSSFPPQHGKSEGAFHWLVRYVSRFPERTCAYVGYSMEFSIGHAARRMMDIADAAGLPIRRDARKLHEWRMPQGGGMIITSVGGQLVGRAINGIIFVDDPIKDPEEAESLTIRNKVSEWFSTVALTRRHPSTSVIVNMTRWHVDDLIGRLTNPESSHWTYVNVPVLNERGEPLWPEERPISFLEEQKREATDYQWSALWMGQPVPRGMSIFNEPARYDQPNLDGAVIYIACDPAATAKTKADRSAIVVGATWRGEDGFPRMDVLDVRLLQVEVPALVRELRGVQNARGCPIIVEAVGVGKPVPQMLRDVDRSLRLIEITPSTDKFVRASPVAAAWNDGRVRVPQRGPWVDALINEARAFTGTGDGHDDQVDALAHLWTESTRRLNVRRTPIETFERLARLG